MTQRSDDEYLAGYALSRLSPASGLPPDCLGALTWKDAYLLFFNRMGAGRTPESFSNSLKNIRDAFDAHVASSPRTGWQDASNLTAPGNQDSAVGRVLGQYSDLPDTEIADRMLGLIRGSDPVNIEGVARTEGGMKVRLVRQTERDPGLRADAIRIHGTDCQACGFSFAAGYGAWGEGFIEIHHMTPLGNGEARNTDPGKDLVPLCANCHRMVHRRPGICLSLAELQALIAQARGKS